MKNLSKLLLTMVLSFAMIASSVKAVDAAVIPGTDIQKIDGVTRTITYEDTVSKNVDGGTYYVQYKIRVLCSYSYNGNTYVMASTTPPRIIEDYMILSSTEASYAFLDNLSTDVVVASNKKSATFTWSFKIKGNVGGRIYTFKTVSDSLTVRV